MSSHCGAINCSASKKSNPERTFHCFPTDPDRSKRWLQLTRRADLMDKSPAYLSECVRLCSKHFEPCQYVPGSNKRLRKNAEPTVFDFHWPPKPHVVKRRRLGRVQEGGEKRASAEQGCEISTPKRFRKMLLEESLATDAASSASSAGTAVPKSQLQDRSAPPGQKPGASSHPSHSKPPKQATKLKRPQKVSVVCCAPNCGASKLSCPYRLFYSFPTDPERCKLWVDACRRAGLMDVSQLELKEKCRLCSAHFDRMQMYPFSGKLMEHAVPTLFDVTSPLSRGEPEESTVFSRVMAENTCFGELKGDSETVAPSGLVIRSAVPLPYNEATAAAVRLVEGKKKTSAVREKRTAVPSPVCEPRAPEPEPEQEPEPWKSLHLGLPRFVLGDYLQEVKRRLEKLRQLEAATAIFEEKENLSPNSDSGKREKVHKNGDPEAGSPTRGATPAPLLTLRNTTGWSKRVREDVKPMSDDLTRPLKPQEAWLVISRLKLHLLAREAWLLEAQKAVKIAEHQLKKERAANRTLVRGLRKKLNKFRVLLERGARESDSTGETKPASNPIVNLKRLTRELDTERERNKGLLRVFTPGQLHTLRTGQRTSFSVEDLRRALEIRRRVSLSAYSYIRSKVGLPMPTAQFLRRAAPRVPALRELYREVLIGNLRKMPFNRKFHLKSEPVHPETMKEEKRVLGIPPRRRKRKNLKKDQPDPATPVSTKEKSMGKASMAGETGSSKKHRKKQGAHPSLVDTVEREEGSDVRRNRPLNSSRSEQQTAPACHTDVEVGVDEITWDDYLLEDFADASREEVEDEVEEMTVQSPLAVEAHQEFDSGWPKENLKAAGLSAKPSFGLGSATHRKPSESRRQSADVDFGALKAPLTVVPSSLPSGISAEPSTSVRPTTDGRLEKSENHPPSVPSSVRVTSSSEATPSSSAQKVTTASRISFVGPAGGANRASASATCRVIQIPFKRVAISTSGNTKHSAKYSVNARQPLENTVHTNPDPAAKPTVHFVIPKSGAAPKAYKVSPNSASKPELRTVNSEAVAKCTAPTENRNLLSPVTVHAVCRKRAATHKVYGRPLTLSAVSGEKRT